MGISLVLLRSMTSSVIADAVLAGALDVPLPYLFSMEDEEMLAAKAGNWWETNPQRGRANNSVVIMRHRVDEEMFFDLWERLSLLVVVNPAFISQR